MTTTTIEQTPTQAPQGWLRSAEAWLDARGRGAWIAAMVLGFIFFWPVGLVLLFYMIATNKFAGGSCAKRMHGRSMMRTATTGNAAFDAYRDETIQRLEDEQAAFEAFLKRLREARDKAEFDQFMDERAAELKEAVRTEEPENRTS